MKGFRSTFILLIVLVALLGYIYYELKPGTQQPAEQKVKVFAVAPDTIEALEIKASSGETTTVVRENGNWHVKAPITVAADATEASGIVSNLAALEVQRVIDEAPSDYAQYGLRPAKVAVGFRTAGAKGFSRIELGDKTATGSDMYARLPGEKKVFLVSSFLETTFDRRTFDLRDKTIIEFERDKADHLQVVSKNTTLAFVKNGEQWRIEKPLAARAEFLTVDGLVGRIKSSPMKAIAADTPTPEQLKAFGITAPTVTATVFVGAKQAQLTIGTVVPGSPETYYARESARPMVFTVEKSLVDDLLRQAGEYRPKDVCEFRPFMVSRLEITRNGTTVVFAKSAGKDGKETWAQVPPAKVADPGKIEEALSAVSGLQVVSYVEPGTKTGAGTPLLTLAVVFGEGKKEDRLTFSRVGTDVFASRAGESSAAKVEAAKFDEVLATVDALK
jgi:hypothetical protein